MPGCDPEDIAVALLTHYELLIDMRHLSRSRLKLPPHTGTDAVNEDFARAHGLSDQLISVLKRLPYIDMSQPGHASTVIMPQTFPVDYTTLGGIYNSRDPLSMRINNDDDDGDDGDENVPAYVDPWETPLAQAFRQGENWMLNVQTGEVTRRNPARDVTVSESELADIPPQCREYTSKGHPKGDAVDMIRGMTKLLKSLECTPINLSEIAHTPSAADSLPVQDPEYLSYAIKALYVECGWPDRFNGDEFVEKKAALELEVANKMH